MGLCTYARWTEHAHGPMLLYMVKSPSWPVDRFRELIDQILRDTGLPQVQLAALVPMDQSQLSRWKSGSSKPKPESLKALGEALAEHYAHLGIGPDELIDTVYPRDATEGADRDNIQEVHSPEAPIDIANITDPSPRESMILAAMAAVHRDLRLLHEKVDALAAERRADREEIDRDTEDRKGA
ncbi:helix-turn-helix transcriptional regulator [Nonomuraea sp. PA05]|uniref:helix-turn-helix domain-containing protein n=1 Tax=Nonomuraea sp. PA05 TaxID=2604466 RepID=UPI0011DBA8E5|nr:helix-turn-helix transcriptional regulator [Nonomuraea sp. PA05]TYB69645.1 helix-turn-helix transcriptional regulator [Nonomuraea sp. PA05]